jgi:hypothetical protein
VDEGAVHLLVEIEIKGVERAVGVAEACLLEASRDEPVLAADELIPDEGGDEIDGVCFSDCAWRKRASRTSAMPERRSLRSA